jgi:hypothetical protein
MLRKKMKKTPIPNYFGRGSSVCVVCVDCELFDFVFGGYVGVGVGVAAEESQGAQGYDR